MEYRCSDVNYGAEYWNTLDGGSGYQDCAMHEDLAFIVHEVFGVRNYTDVAGSINILEMGCAAGFLVHHLRRRGHDAWGVDISEYALSLAHEETKPYLRQHDLTARGLHHQFGDESFKLVVCFETLEHIPACDVDEALSRIRGTMTPDGLAVLTICTAEHPNPFSDPTHVTIQPRAWWEAFLTAMGLVPVPALEDRLREFYLFHHHRGVFVVRKAWGQNSSTKKGLT